MNKRPRRNRRTAAVRALLQETHLHPAHFAVPLFILEGNQRKEEIKSMPKVYRYSVDLLIQEVAELYELGIRAIDLFCYVPVEKKDASASEAVRPGNLLQRALRSLRKEVPGMCLMVRCRSGPFYGPWP